MRIYYDSKGKIYAVTRGKSSIPGMLFLELPESKISFSNEYVNVDTKLIEQRPQFSIVCDKISIRADNNDACIINNIPVGTVCKLDGESISLTGNEIHFTAQHAGTYVFTFSLFPYLDKTITITAESV